jgi:hypothetical protein
VVIPSVLWCRMDIDYLLWTVTVFCPVFCGLARVINRMPLPSCPASYTSQRDDRTKLALGQHFGDVNGTIICYRLSKCPQNSATLFNARRSSY